LPLFFCLSDYDSDPDDDDEEFDEDDDDDDEDMPDDYDLCLLFTSLLGFSSYALFFLLFSSPILTDSFLPGF